jgi:hypothetical protein
VQGRGLLIILLIIPFLAFAQDEFAEFEEIPEPPSTAEKPSIDVPADELEATPLPTLPEEEPIAEEPKLEEPKAEEPKLEEPKLAEPEPPPESGTPEPLPTQLEPPSLPTASDDPDSEIEARFHEIYSRFNKSPITDEEWIGIITGRGTYTYDIQKGDTLWDISKTLFDDVEVWPKIWAKNNDIILNPHEIEPQVKIKFHQGSIIDVPKMTVSKTTVKKEGQVPQEVSIVETPPPPPSRISRKLRKIPESLPLYRYTTDPPKETVHVEEIDLRIPTPLVFVNHYIDEGDMSAAGQVLETEQGGITAFEFQYIIVRIDDPSQKHFYAVKNIETLKSRWFKHDAKLMELQGEIEILDQVDPNKNIFRAIVTKTISPIEVGAMLVVGRLPRGNVTPSPIASGVEATIIGGQDASMRKLFAKNQLIYIDAGQSQGVREGQSMNIFTNLKSRNGKSVVENKNRQIGVVKILRTTENFSTGYILESSEDVWRGDSVGGGTQVALTIPKDRPAPAVKDDIILDPGFEGDGTDQLTE